MAALFTSACRIFRHGEPEIFRLPTIVLRGETGSFGDAMMKPVTFLRKVSMAEGISYLLLLLVAMPLKYWGGMPMAVRVVGSLHGLLFVVLCVALLWALIQARWPFLRAVLVFVLSFVPFAPLFLDRRMKAWEGELR